VGELRVPEIRPRQLGIAQIGGVECRCPETGRGQIGRAQIVAAQIRPGQIGLGQFGFLERGMPPVRDCALAPAGAERWCSVGCVGDAP
jgi:hypothetical protein